MKKTILNILIGVLVTFAIVRIFFLFFNSAEREQQTISRHSEIVEKIESIGRLELVRMHVQDIVEHELVRQWLPNAKAILIIKGEAVGCIDLTKIKKENLNIAKDTIKLLLPAPELCYCKIDHSNSKVFNTQNNFFSGAELIDGAYKEAEKYLEKTVLNSGILQKTKDNAFDFFVPFFESLGFKEVYIMFEKENTMNN